MRNEADGLVESSEWITCRHECGTIAVQALLRFPIYTDPGKIGADTKSWPGCAWLMKV